MGDNHGRMCPLSVSPRLRRNVLEILAPLAPLVVLAPLAALPGCGISQESFHLDFATQYCALLFECEDAAALAALGWTDVDTCVADQSEVDTGETEYDRRAAKECLAALANVTCEDLDANTFPVVCAQVE